VRMVCVSLIFSLFVLLGVCQWVPAWMSWKGRAKLGRLDGPSRSRRLARARPGMSVQDVRTPGLALLDTHSKHSMVGRTAALVESSRWQRSASLLAGSVTAAALTQVVARSVTARRGCNALRKETRASQRVPCRAAEPDLAGIVAMREKLENAWDLPAVSRETARGQSFESARISDATGKMWKTLLSQKESSDWYMSQIARVASVCLWSCVLLELYQLFGPDVHMDPHDALILTCAAVSLRRLRRAKSQHRRLH